MTSKPSERQSTGSRLRTWLQRVGPALVLATVVIGPGTLTLNTIAGTTYGYALLWVPLVATVFMIVYTWLSARISLATGETLFELARARYGRSVAVVGGIFAYLAVLAFQAGNNAAVGFAAEALFGLTPRSWAVLFFVPALGLIFLPNLYGKIELLVKVVVGLMLLSFVGTLVMVGIQPDAAVRGIVPSFPDTEAIFLTLGMAATTFSIVAAVYQGYLMKEKKWGPDELAGEGVDTLIGIGILGGISTVILLTSAGAIYAAGGDPIFSAQGMAAQLEPLVGSSAFYLFTIGFFFASFSSLVVNPLIGATLLADGLDRDASMDGKPVKLWTSIAMAAGLLVVLVFEAPPVELIRFAQGLAVVAFPLLGFLVLTIARDRDVMGEYASRTWIHVVAVIGYITIVGIVLNYLRQIAAVF
ncbi:MAG: Nramp family divalent metal transporter [Rhodothermales bacterium]